MLSFRTSEEEVLITRMLEKVLRRSDAVDKESLCVMAGQRVSGYREARKIPWMILTFSLGVASTTDYSFPCGCREYDGLRVYSRNNCIETLQKAGG